MPTITRKIELKLCTEGLSDEVRKAQYVGIKFEKICGLLALLANALFPPETMPFSPRNGAVSLCYRMAFADVGLTGGLKEIVGN